MEDVKCVDLLELKFPAQTGVIDMHPKTRWI